MSQPMRHFPEHYMVDATEYICPEVGELVERRPSHQLAVQAGEYVDRSTDTMIAGKDFGEPANKPLGLFLGYRKSGSSALDHRQEPI